MLVSTFTGLERRWLLPETSGARTVSMDQARTVTVTFSSTNGVAQLAAGAVHTCALYQCWQREVLGKQQRGSGR